MSSMNSHLAQNGTDAELPVDLLAQVAAKVQELHAGDAHGAGEWLTTFQKSECAWQVCIDTLQVGPLPERIPLQFFAAQTLARVSRAFATRLRRDCWELQHGQLCQLLKLHSTGPPVVWRQLALALTCADLWCGTWAAAAIISAASLPTVVRHELLALPPELLYCERALPLDDSALWQKAAASLEDSCGDVFRFILNDSGAPAAACLSALGVWLRALRKGVEWIPQSDDRIPLKALSASQHRLLVLAGAAPPQAAEVAQQLALFRCGRDAEVLLCLQPLLADLLPRLTRGNHYAALLPLLSDLAVDRWPRAALGMIPLDWHAIASAALDLLGAAASKTFQDNLAGCEAEDTFGVWQLLATTMCQGTWEWKATSEQLRATPEICTCFELFCNQAVSALTLRGDPQNEQVEALFRMREVAEKAVAAWGRIFGGTQAWEEAIWQPLRRVRGVCAENLNLSSAPFLELCRNAEVAMWWAATLAVSAHDKGASCASSVVLELPMLDLAPLPWRALLWSAACGLAPAARGDLSLQLLAWMLHRPPSISYNEVPWLLIHTELPYAQQVEVVCRQVPSGSHLEHAEQLARLALEPIRPGALHEDSARARGLLLWACRRVLGGDAVQVCSCLSQAVLAPLREAVEMEAQARVANDQWPAVEVLCAALEVTLPEVPTAGAQGTDNRVGCIQAAMVIWEANWDMMQAALLMWTPSQTTNQPVQAASEALAGAAVKLGPILKPALALLVESISKSVQPHAQIKAIRRIVSDLNVPHVELTSVAALLTEAIVSICKVMLSRQGGLGQNPTNLEALFHLMAVSIQMAPKSTPAVLHLKQGHLRPQLLGHEGLVKRCLEVVADALPECPTEGGVEWTLVFVARLLKGLKEGREVNLNLHETLRLALPQLSLAITQALACQPQLTKVESAHYVAEVLLQIAEVFPQDAEVALSNSLDRLTGLGIPDYSRHRLARHVQQRSQWAGTGAWIEGLQQIAFDWQNERRQSII